MRTVHVAYLVICTSDKDHSVSGYTFHHGKGHVIGCMGLRLMYCMIDKWFLQIRNLGLRYFKCTNERNTENIGALNHHTLASHIILITTAILVLAFCDSLKAISNFNFYETQKLLLMVRYPALSLRFC